MLGWLKKMAHLSGKCFGWNHLPYSRSRSSVASAVVPPNNIGTSSHFNLQPKALRDEEPIKLLYSSPRVSNKKLEHYIHLVAVSQETKDTVNILTVVDNGFTTADADKIYNYLGPDNVTAQISMMDPEELTETTDLNKLPKKTQKDIRKVTRDPNFDNIANNHFPTVIGMIGTVTPP